MKSLGRSYLIMLAAILVGVLTGFSNSNFLLQGASAVSTLFMNFLKLIAGPIVFLSIASTLSGMKGMNEMKTLGKKVFQYTILTTILAATIALILFLILDPAQKGAIQGGSTEEVNLGGTYLSFLLQIVPSNFFGAFLENNVLAIAFMAFLLGIAALKLPKETGADLHRMLSSLFKAVLKITQFVISLLPIAIWAFTALLVVELKADKSNFHSLFLYLACVLGANLIQGLVVIPLLLKLKGLSPWATAKGSMRALMLAFFSKSSNATLPITMECAENNLKVSSKVSSFSLPLCTVINMNGCAAFILTTVLFVAKLYGQQFSPFDLGLWVVLATLAAVGNAGVPMGCFFLSSSFLIGMGVPIQMMALILPFYTFLDMVETALNVWSDVSVTTIVDKELKETAVLESV
jgi:Na+/H+-dicarboxylate symporter